MKSKLYTRLMMVFTTILMFTFIATAQTTISVQISEIGDDTEEVAEEGASDPIGTMDATSSDLEFIEDDGYLQFVGLIFRNVQIPPNANITNAYIQFYSDKALDGVPVTCKLFGGSVANISAPFSEDLFSVSSHAQTTAKVSWTVPPFGNPGVATEAERSPDISAIIQEIIAINGWASGNNLMIGVENDADGKTANREAVSFDGEPTQAPILNVTFNTNPLAVNPIRDEISNSIYPNPAEGILNIQNPSTDKFSYEIYTINGKLVARRNNITGSTTEVDLINFAKGVYFVNVKNAEKTKTHKLILK
ncbi:T9SS type A sorting domain-containing protein [Bacteroidota bacterium]